MDWSKKKRPELISESCEDIQTKCGCITLKGVVRSCLYDHGFSCDEVEMTAPFPSRKRPLFAPNDYILDDGEPFGAKALRKIYRGVLKERSRERYLQRNKTKIAEVLPIWFANDAQIGLFNASERKARRDYTRQAQRGEISVNEINKHLAPIRAMMELNREATMRKHEQEVDIALRLRDLRDLEFNYNDACQLFGEDIWVLSLERRVCQAGDISKMNEVAINRFNDFAFLYNMPLPEFESGDILEGIGFGIVMLATALRRNNEVVAVGAIDDVRGRKALRALVGNKRLAEILPKRVYQAVTRHEQFCLQGSLFYSKQKREESIIIY
ncbi:MAG: hypothetical protein IKA07_04400 [Alistipes sp.]|nr:hypothetical protein [Alistipes sp.]